MEDDLTLDGGHTRQYTDHVSQNCILGTDMILLNNVTTIHLIYKGFFKRHELPE